MTLKTCSLIAFLLLFFDSSLFGQDALIGNWFAEDFENSTIQIYKGEDTHYYAKIIDSDKKEFIDQIVLRKMIYNADKNQWKGIVYSPNRKKEINGTLSLESTGELKLIGEKYFIRKTFYWTKQE